MLSFNRIRMADKDRITELFHAEKDRGCEYTFGNVYIWHDVYCTEAAFSDDGLCVIRFACEVDAYLFPCGQGDIKAAVEDMLTDAEARGVPFRIIAANKDDVDRLDALFPGLFAHHVNRDFCEYVYDSEDLIQLAGKKYHGKRNHISRFVTENPDYEFVEFAPDNIAEVRAMNEAWYKEYTGDDEGLVHEKTAANYAFDNFFQLDFKGGFIRAGGRVVAFAIGEPINGETFCVHIEKACHDVTGAYAIINRDFAQHFCGEYRYINREDDAGVEGLRRAKLSYYPAIITEKYVVDIK